MNAVATRFEEMEDAAYAFHEENPKVWKLLHRFTMEKIRQGFKHYSVNGVFERIRWETNAGANGPNQFKIGNNHRPFYARWWMEAHPRYKGFFLTRIQKSKFTPACGLPEIGPGDVE